MNKIGTYNKIVKALFKNKVSKAMEIYQNISNKLKTINQLILKDIIVTADNNLIDSIKITNEIIEKYPDDFIGYLLQSITYFLMDNYERSLEIIEKALEVAPNVLLTCQKAQIFIRMFRGDEALDLIEDNLIKYPGNSTLLRIKYILYIMHWMSLVKDYNNPLNVISQLIDLNPNDQEILLLKSLYYCEINKYKEAKRLITEEIELNNFKKNPKIDTIAYFILAYSYLARGKFEKSLETANLVLTLYPDHPLSFLTKALVFGYNLIHRFTFKELNIVTFTELIELTISFDPIKYNKTRYLQLQAYILNGLGKYDESINSIDRAIKLVPTLIPLYITKTYLLLISKREAEALNWIIKLLVSYPSLKKNLMKQKSYIHVLLKQYDEGLKVVDEAIELFSNDTDFINDKAMILGYLGRREEAIKTAEYLISLYPKYGNSYDTYGELLMALGEYENAIEKFKEALNLEPTGWFAVATCLKMGECFKELENMEKALEYYEKGKKLTEKMHPSYHPRVEKLISEVKASFGETKDREAKLEWFVWQNILEEFQTFLPSSQPVGTIEEEEPFYCIDKPIFEVVDIVYLSKLNFLNSDEFQDIYNIKREDSFNKIVKLLYKDKISKAKDLYESNSSELQEINQLILEDLIATAENNFEESIKITNNIIKKYSSDFIGY
ncbi:MAG: tetratricopeptide repeat protein, partial [Candidatus Hodarchaeota archaeon]